MRVCVLILEAQTENKTFHQRISLILPIVFALIASICASDGASAGTGVGTGVGTAVDVDADDDDGMVLVLFFFFLFRIFVFLFLLFLYSLYCCASKRSKQKPFFICRPSDRAIVVFILSILKSNYSFVWLCALVWATFNDTTQW